MLKIDPEDTAKQLTEFLKKTFTDAGFSKAVLGVSGGVDSATSCVLAVRALGAANLYPVLMPYGILNTRGTLDAMDFIQSLAIPIANITRLDIKPAIESLSRSEGQMTQIRRGNMMARMRMVVLFDQAKKREALVVGTENKSEHLLGYYTRYGDAASDLEPLRNLYKTQVYQLARYFRIPENIISKPPSADLWPEQTDEQEFGFTYAAADEILHLATDIRKTPEEIINTGYDRSMVERVFDRVHQNSFKNDLPYIPANKT